MNSQTTNQTTFSFKQNFNIETDMFVCFDSF